MSVDEKAVAMLAQAADGSVRDALTLFDQAIAYAEGEVTPEVVTEILGGIDFALVADLAETLIRRDVSGALALLDRVVAEGKDLRQLVGHLLGHYRNLLVLSVDRRGAEALSLPEEAVGRVGEQAKRLSADEITRALDLLAETDRELRFSSQPRLLVELAAVRICRGPAAAAPAAAAPLSAEEGAEPAAAEVPEPAVAEAAEAPEEGEAVGLAEIKRRWDEVLADLRKARQASLSAILREAVPVALEEEALTLAFNHQFHHDHLAKDEKRRESAAEAITRVFGRKVTIKCQMTPEGERARGAAHPKRVQDALSAFPGSEVDE